MKTSKKIIALLLSLTMLFALASCGQKTNDGDNKGNGGNEGKTGLKIAICTSPNTVDDGSFNEDNYDGILAFIASRGDIDTVTPVREESGDPAAAVQTVAGIVADYDVLVCTGFQFQWGLKN